MENFILEIIHEMGIPVNCRGFWYLKDAVIMLLERDEEHMLITKDLYPEIAKRYHTSAAGVEKAMRNAICKFWDRSMNDNRGFNDSDNLHYPSKKPTNSQFVYYMLEEAKSKRKRITK